MPNGKDTWIRRWSRSEDRMQKASTLLNIVVGLIAVGSCVGGLVWTHAKFQADMEAKLYERDLKARETHEELMLELATIKAHVRWTERSVEDLAKDIPQALELHEARMHPKEFNSPGSPTKFKVVLPKKDTVAAGW